MSRVTVLALAVSITMAVATGLNGQPPAAVADEETAVHQVTQDLVKAFNANKAEEVAALFFSGGDLIDDSGAVHKGTVAIQDAFSRFFAKFPGASSTMMPDSVWLIGPALAIEEGRRVVSTKDGAAAAGSRYTLVMIKEQGRWKIASGRELADDDALSPHERLEPLAWMVGDWVNEGSDAVVQMSCKWSEDKNYLLIDFVAEIQGRPTLKSNQRIGWDPLMQKIKSWVFDSDGGYGVGVWSQIADHWVIKSNAVLPDGSTGSATIVVEPNTKDSYTMKGFDRIRGNTAEPDFKVTVVRKPPAPVK